MSTNNFQLCPDVHDVKMFLYRHPTDLRKSYDTLAALASTVLGENPLSGALFVFFKSTAQPGEDIVLRKWRVLLMDEAVGSRVVSRCRLATATSSKSMPGIWRCCSTD